MRYVQTTHVLIDVKERRHDGILDGSQIWLIPVDVEHSSHTPATGAVTGHVLQEKGLLTTERQRERNRQGGGMLVIISLRWLQWHIRINCQTDTSWIIPGDWDYLQINSLLSHVPFLMLTPDPANFNHHHQLPLAMDWNKPSKLFIFQLHLILWFGLYHNVWLILITETLSERRQTT